MPIHAPTLLTDLKRWVTRFEDDLRQQCKDVPALDARLKAQYKLAKDAGRTAFSYAVWRDGELTQSAVGWVLSCVFVRFLEDNDLLERSFLSGVGENRGVADETRAAYFRENRAASDNDYLAHVMSEVGKLPGMADLMDARHNALWNAAISPDAAKAFIEFWRRIDPGTGKMAHEFTDPDFRAEPGETPGSRDPTRFLGDLYQDLSESARKKFALLQTPDFVEEFILDRTLDPAIDTFGLKVVRMIDPTCGSGHFLLGGFRRLLALWEKQRPDLSDKERAVKALDGVYGVDINPFAVAIARFRLLLAAWRYCEVKRLRSAPDFKVNLAVGDSLLHGARFDAEGKPYTMARESLFGGDELVFKDETAHHFEVEDAKELHRILGQQYHAVVGNPPYIQAADASLNRLYRERYKSCSGKYSLSVPFLERFFDLAVGGSAVGSSPVGFVGQITGNSFMKRKFGSVIIEEFIPKWDVTHVIDSSGAYIPGHNTSTVILFGRNRSPVTPNIRILESVKGEPAVPANPALAHVWSDLVAHIDCDKAESEYFITTSPPRKVIEKHPWILSRLARSLSEQHKKRLGKGRVVGSIGAVTLEDDAFVLGDSLPRILGGGRDLSRELVVGDLVRDWAEPAGAPIVFPYDRESNPKTTSELRKGMWILRTPLRNRIWFRKTQDQRGMEWCEYGFLSKEIASSALLITFAFVATHNHFVLDRGGKVFNRSSPVIRIKSGAVEEDLLELLGVLNSSTACFWMKQVFYPKGGDHVGQEGARVRKTLWDERYEFDGTKLKQYPVVAMQDLILVHAIQKYADAIVENVPEKILEAWSSTTDSLAECFDSAKNLSGIHMRRLIYWQEELDWQVYELYGLIDPEDQLVLRGDEAMNLLYDRPLSLGERTFEILMARQMADGDLETTWFERHKDAGSRSITELPADWPDDYRALVERRLAFIEANKNLNLIERPEYKRRWNTEPWAKRQQAALEKWLLTRLETYFHDADRMVSGEDEAATAAKLAHIRPLRARFAGGTEPRLVSVRQLAQTAQADSQWMEAATVFAGRADFDVAKLVETLVLAESVPALPAQRYKPAGLRHRIEWEKTWELQRAEDAVEEEMKREQAASGKPLTDVARKQLDDKIRAAQREKVGEIPVPPKYKSSDFLKSGYWKLRGKLDVPKERWTVYPGMEGGHDTSPVISWAGWDHAQQAQALTSFYQQAKDTWAWTPERLAPLLAALKELLPWLHQWHNAIDPEFGDRPCDSYQQFYTTELHALRMTDEDIEVIRMGTQS